jgi:hypothetical protein
MCSKTGNSPPTRLPQLCPEADRACNSLDFRAPSFGFRERNRAGISFTPVGADTVSLNGVTYSGFHYCKIVASKTNPNPVYPDDGYLYYTSELTASYWSVEPGSDSYNQSPVLESGSTYYFSVTYVFDNGKFSSNTVQLAVP